MKKVFIICGIVLLLIGCKKTATSNVLIRIENSTNFTLDSVQLIYDVSNFNYGTVSPNETTDYHLFESLPNDAAVNFSLNGELTIAGRLFPPNSQPYPILSNGNYTLHIFADTTLVTGYNTEFLKQ